MALCKRPPFTFSSYRLAYFQHPPHTCTLCASTVYLLHTLSPLFTPPHTLCCSECIVCRVCRVHCTPHTYASGVLLSFVMTCINYTLHTLYALTPLHPSKVSQILINSTLTLHYYALALISVPISSTSLGSLIGVKDGHIWWHAFFKVADNAC